MCMYICTFMYMNIHVFVCMCGVSKIGTDFFFESVQIQMLFSSWCQCTFFLMVHKKSYTLTNLGGSML